MQPDGTRPILACLPARLDEDRETHLTPRRKHASGMVRKGQGPSGGWERRTRKSFFQLSSSSHAKYSLSKSCTRKPSAFESAVAVSVRMASRARHMSTT